MKSALVAVTVAASLTLSSMAFALGPPVQAVPGKAAAAQWNGSGHYARTPHKKAWMTANVKQHGACHMPRTPHGFWSPTGVHSTQ